MKTLTEHLATVRPLPSGRQPLVDALRGLALLGILLVNIEFIVQSSELGWAAFTGPVDLVVRGLVVGLGQTKIYPLFALLFGYGFSMQLASARARGVDLRPRSRRRMAGLAVLGVLHGILFFPGDILLIYAVIGWITFRLRDRSTRWLLRTAALTHGAAAVAWLLLGVLDMLEFVPMAGPSARELAVLADGSFVAVVGQHVISWAETQAALVVIQGPAVFAYYLAGMALGRGDLLAAPQRHRELFGWIVRRLGPPAVVVSAFGAWLAILGGPVETLGFALGFAAAPMLAATYLAIVALIVRRSVGMAQMAGRASLTVYLAESVLAAAISYGYGLGRFGLASPLEGVAWAVTIWLVLVACVAGWLRLFRNGPLEWGLRSLTYGKWQPLLRE